jgi:hypothetical protein
MFIQYTNQYRRHDGFFKWLHFTRKCLNIKPIFLKLWIFTNLNMVFPVVVLGFDFDEFEGVLHAGPLQFYAKTRIYATRVATKDKFHAGSVCTKSYLL